MRYTTDDMRNWAKDEGPDYGLGGVACAMREAAAEIDRLRQQRDELVGVIRELAPADQLPIRQKVSFETAELIYA